MSAPRILDAHQASAALLAGLDLSSLLDDPARSAFVVTRSGTFGGRWFERGEVLVCSEGARNGQAVVLVAHTRGWPMLGHQRGLGFTGDRGEPCSHERWCTAGTVVEVWQRQEDLAWQQIPLGGALDVAPGVRAPRPAASGATSADWEPVVRSVDFSQLPLFQTPAGARAA